MSQPIGEGQPLPTAYDRQPNKLGFGRVQQQAIRGHPTRESINSVAHPPNRSYCISCAAVDIRLYVVSVKLVQQTT